MNTATSFFERSPRGRRVTTNAQDEGRRAREKPLSSKGGGKAKIGAGWEKFGGQKEKRKQTKKGEEGLVVQNK